MYIHLVDRWWSCCFCCWCWLTDDMNGAHTHTQTRSATVPKRNGLFRTMFGKLDEFLINFYAELLALPGPHHHAPINYSSAPYGSTLLQRMLCHRPTDITLPHWCVCVFRVIISKLKTTLKCIIFSPFVRHNHRKTLNQTNRYNVVDLLLYFSHLHKVCEWPHASTDHCNDFVADLFRIWLNLRAVEFSVIAASHT